MKDLPWCLEQWARVLRMCEGTSVNPSACWAACGGRMDSGEPPMFMRGSTHYDCNQYTFAIAIVEQKPCFVGDTLFSIFGGEYIVNIHIATDMLEMSAWNPPKKKTFTFDGVELPAPDFAEGGWGLSDRTTWRNQADAQMVQDAFDNLK